MKVEFFRRSYLLFRHFRLFAQKRFDAQAWRRESRITMNSKMDTRLHTCGYDGKRMDPRQRPAGMTEKKGWV